LIILGLNAFHADSAACLVKDGILLAAVEEERFRRIKHWAGLPSMSIRYCLEQCNLCLSDVDVIAINQDSKAHVWKKIAYAIRKRPELSLVVDKIRKRKNRSSMEDQLKEIFPNETFRGKVNYIEHHLCHLSSAYHVSPYNQAVVVSVDGFGDFSSGAWGIGEGNNISINDRVYFPHSLGSFYQALTQYLGFPNYGDEYKIMGLAPYGKPNYIEQMRKIVSLEEKGQYRLNLNFFRHHSENVVFQWENGSPACESIYSQQLIDLLGPVRGKEEKLSQHHFDIAHSVQYMYEEAFFNLLNYTFEQTGLENIALAGGCAMNSVANGKIYRRTNYKHAYIQSAAGDAGGAIGAAMTTWFQHNPKSIKTEPMDHAYFGPEFSRQQILKIIESNQDALETQACTINEYSDLSQLCRETAIAIADGKVIGWFQGRMEWGPRALGNRSILADPRRADMKDILNQKIKRRESFRPFAPSIIREQVNQWFEEDDDVPFMMQVFQIKESQRRKIPAVTHVDGSGRLQTVSEHTNPRYYALIKAFQYETDVPIVLNTSFNENEPVVCTPQEALDCFLRTKMDVLVCGDFFIRREN